MIGQGGAVEEGETAQRRRGVPGRRAPRRRQLNPSLMAEVAYIARLSDPPLIKYGRVDRGRLAKAAQMSDEGLAGIMVLGQRPTHETLQKLAAYARTLDPLYSLVRLYRAAGYLPDEELALYARAVAEHAPAEAAQLQTAADLRGLTPEDLSVMLVLVGQLQDTLGRLARVLGRAPDSASPAPGATGPPGAARAR